MRKDVGETLSYVALNTIKLLKKQLKVPLIGFCGGPRHCLYLYAKEQIQSGWEI